MVGTTQKIVRVFVEKTGHAPHRLSQSQLNASRELAQRFGYFLIADHPSEPGLDDLYGAEWDPRDKVWWRLEPEAERGSSPAHWVANRIYGRVVVSWWNEEKLLDSRWDDLTSIVREALGPTQ
jgi:hypothetical protein